MTENEFQDAVCKMSTNLSRSFCVNGFIKYTFCKLSFPLPFKAETIPILEVMKLCGYEAREKRPGDATRYEPF